MALGRKTLRLPATHHAQLKWRWRVGSPPNVHYPYSLRMQNNIHYNINFLCTKKKDCLYPPPHLHSQLVLLLCLVVVGHVQVDEPRSFGDLHRKRIMWYTRSILSPGIWALLREGWNRYKAIDTRLVGRRCCVHGTLLSIAAPLCCFISSVYVIPFVVSCTNNYSPSSFFSFLPFPPVGRS